MNSEKKMMVLQQTYAGVLADSVRQLGIEGVLEKVTARKKQEQLKSGGFIAAQLGITKPEEVFTRLSDIFNCAQWETVPHPNGFTAETTTCMLAAMAKKTGSPCPCPCYIHCLNPMEGMVKALAPQAMYEVRETLWAGKRCTVNVLT